MQVNEGPVTLIIDTKEPRNADAKSGPGATAVKEESAAKKEFAAQKEQKRLELEKRTEANKQAKLQRMQAHEADQAKS